MGPRTCVLRGKSRDCDTRVSNVNDGRRPTRGFEAASVRALSANSPGERGGYEELGHFDPFIVLWVVALAVSVTLLAGFYPAWPMLQRLRRFSVRATA